MNSDGVRNQEVIYWPTPTANCLSALKDLNSGDDNSNVWRNLGKLSVAYAVFFLKR
jgi:hypothetical protein